MKGLEAKEVNFNIFNKDLDYRLEAEYWNKKSTIKIATFNGVDIIEAIQYGTSEELNEFKEGYPVLRLNEFNSLFIGVPEKYCNLLSKEEFENYRLLKGDVLICRTNGNPQLVGRSAVVPEDTNFAYASYLFKVRPKKELINSETLVAFLRCKYGRQEINAYSMVGNQTNFSPAKFREISIPKLGKGLNEKIKENFTQSNLDLKKSELLYKEAETVLLKELGLANWKPSIKNSNTKTLKESFLQTGRFDAEYYQPKYDELEEGINKFETISFKDLTIYPIVSGSTPKAGESEYYTDENEGIPFIRAVDIIGGRISLDSPVYIKNFVHQKLLKRTQLKIGDVLISIAGTVGRSGVFDHNIEANINQACAILRFEETEVQRLYVMMFINSKIGQLITEKVSRQGVQTNLNLEELGSISIPIIAFKTQSIISQKIQQSFDLQTQSKQLLEIAKIAVEIAIEKSEKEAINYINKNNYA